MNKPADWLVPNHAFRGCCSLFAFYNKATCFAWLKKTALAYPQVQLTHLPLDKMADILADDKFKRMFLNENASILIQVSLKFVPKGPIDNKSALVQVMAWRRTGDKPLPEAMMTQFTDAYMRQ